MTVSGGLKSISGGKLRFGDIGAGFTAAQGDGVRPAEHPHPLEDHHRDPPAPQTPRRAGCGGVPKPPPRELAAGEVTRIIGEPRRKVRAARQGPPPRRPSPWLTRRRAWVKDGSRESFSAISSGRYFSSMPEAQGAGAPAGKEEEEEEEAAVRGCVPGGGKSSEAALPNPGRLPPGAAGTHPEGSAASPRPRAGREGAPSPPPPVLLRARTNPFNGDALLGVGGRSGSQRAGPQGEKSGGLINLKK